jgi:hypothetical protein
VKKRHQHKVVKHRVVKHKVVKATKKAKAVAVAPKKAEAVAVAPKTASARASLRIAGASTKSSNSFALLLGVALGLSLLVIVVAATPPAMLPRQIAGPVYENREAIIYCAVATAISIGLGLGIALLGL